MMEINKVVSELEDRQIVRIDSDIDIHKVTAKKLYGEDCVPTRGSVVIIGGKGQIDRKLLLNSVY